MLSRLIKSRIFFWTLLCVPGVVLIYQVKIGAFGDEVLSSVQDFLGSTALGLLILVLCLTPLIRLFPKGNVANALNTHRRAIGVSCYLYAVAHAMCFFIEEPSFVEAYLDLQNFAYLQFGLTTLILLFPLFLTSNDFSVKRLTYKWWKLIHRLVYFAAFSIFMHRAFGEQDRLFTTVLIFLPIILLEALRVGHNIKSKLFKKPALAAPQSAAHKVEKPAWEGYRQFVVDRKVQDHGDICSFYLKPKDGEPLPSFKPGQYLTFKFQIPNQEKPIIRCYSISDAPNEDYYRISVKRARVPRNKPEAHPGVSSNYLHDVVNEGGILDVKAPAGGFVLDPPDKKRIVLIGAGVGITPVLSMLKHRINVGIESDDEVWFFYGTYCKDQHFAVDYFEELKREHPEIKLRFCYSNPESSDKLNEDYHLKGFVSVDYIRSQIPDNDFDFYFCGPGPMMQSVMEGLEAWNVDPDHIHFEAFGPSTVKPKRIKDRPKVAEDTDYHIHFEKSGVDLIWDGSAANLLEFGEAGGVKLPFGCRAGVCGSCKVPVLVGHFDYETIPAADPGEGACLTCQAFPKGNMVIDA